MAKSRKDQEAHGRAEIRIGQRILRWDGPPAGNPPLSNEALDKIVRAARVPQEHESAALYHVQMAVVEVLDGLNRRSSGPRPRTALKRIARLCRELREALDGESRGCLEVWFEGQLDQLDDTDEKVDLYDLDSLIGDLEQAAKDAMFQPQKKAPHRPIGSVENRAFHRLINFLYAYLVEVAHGELSVRKNACGELKGTAPAVLEILRPHLQGIVPGKLSYSTLRRILQSARGAIFPNGPDYVSGGSKKPAKLT
jgi:hypothetical protein